MIEIKNSPPIPGLRFRHFQGEGDFAQFASVLVASEAADHLDRNVSADDLANAYRHMNNCDPYQDVIIAEVHGEIVGYGRGWWEGDINSGLILHHNAFLRSEWRRKGIGGSMLRWMETRLTEVAKSHPTGTRCFQVNVTQYQQTNAIMLERAGYQPVRYFYEMVRPTLEDIVEFPLPAGLEVRPVIPEHYPALWKNAIETSKDEWGYSEPTEDDYREWLASPHFQPQLWQVAWDVATNQVVGSVLTFIDEAENKQRGRNRGYTEGIGVDRAWRRRGVARALISRSLQAQKAAGMIESALVADTDSSSNVVSLYESCGFQVVKRDAIYRKYF